MRLHYKGKYSGEESSLPVRNHPEGYVPFREPENMKKMAVILNVAAFLLMIIAAVPAVLRGMSVYNDFAEFYSKGYFQLFGGILLSMAALFPHELLHAMCFREDVELYTNLKQGMLFVVGTEYMSRGRFVFMSLLPNIIFGFIPYILYLIFPSMPILAGLGVISVGSGAGDYMNVVNCMTQVPRGAKVYMSGMHSFWVSADKAV